MSTEELGTRCLLCKARNTLHILIPCPRWRHTKWGLLFCAMENDLNGVVVAHCTACGNDLCRYVDAERRQVWKWEAVDSLTGWVLLGLPAAPCRT